MFNPIRRLPSFNSVAAGSTASIIIPTGQTYQTIVLRYKESGADVNEATMKASITKVRLKINGTTRFEASGKHIIDCLNKFYGIAFVAGQLVIPLTRPWLKTIEGEDNLGWGTANVNTFGLEVDIAAGATAPTLTADAVISPQNRDLGIIVQVSEMSFAAAVSGDYEISTLPKGNGNLVALHLENANITKIRAVADGYVLNDGDLAIMNTINQWTGLRVPQTGYVHLDALFKNRLGDTWPLAGVQDFRVIPTLSSAGSVPIVMETLNNPFGNIRT